LEERQFPEGKRKKGKKGDPLGQKPVRGGAALQNFKGKKKILLAQGKKKKKKKKSLESGLVGTRKKRKKNNGRRRKKNKEMSPNPREKGGKKGTPAKIFCGT